jgi:DNA-binding XRE family transcriptional regulator
MPNKRPPNAEATQFRTGEEQVEIARQGGLASGKARREKQKTQQILADLVSIKNKDLASFEKEAKKMGLEGDISIHEVFTMVCLLNSVKSGNLGDLERLSKLLGEDKQNENADVLAKLDKVIGEVDKLAK